jgi:hypothetical protein
MISGRCRSALPDALTTSCVRGDLAAVQQLVRQDFIL